MSKYVVAIGAGWGDWVFDAIQYPNELWVPVRTPQDLSDVVVHTTPRYVFLLSWGHPVNKTQLATYEHVNFHLSPLPFGRGGNPIENMLKAGYHDTTVTAFRQTPEVDAGPIYGVSVAVSLRGTKAEILARCVPPVAGLVRQIVVTQPTPVAQDEAAVTRFTRLPDADYIKFWATKVQQERTWSDCDKLQPQIGRASTA